MPMGSIKCAQDTQEAKLILGAFPDTDAEPSRESVWMLVQGESEPTTTAYEVFKCI